MFPLPRGVVVQTFFLGLLCLIIKGIKSETRVVCYYTNWSVYRPGTAKFNPQNINPYLCTHLIYAFGGFTKDNTLKPFDKYQDVEQGGYAKFTGLKTYNKQLKTLLAIGGWNEGSSRFSPLMNSLERRQQFVKNILKFLRQNHFDGLDLDWEYPAYRDGGKSRDKDNYAQFVQELRAEFDRESSKTGRSRLLITMAVPAGIEYVEKGYDIAKLNKYLDWFNILSYDYHSAYEPSVNHHAPLYSLEEDNEYNYDGELNIDYTVKHYLNAGAERDKIVLGIPTYGRSYTLINEESNELGAPSDGPGEQGDATREKGYLAYYEICQNLKEDPDWTVIQPNPKAMGPYAFKKNQWVGYDDEDIVRKKAHYVANNQLGGIMFWSIDNDDFRGTCTGKQYPLIEAAKEALLDKLGPLDNEVSQPNRQKKPPRARSRKGQSNQNKIESPIEEDDFSSRKQKKRPPTRILTSTTTRRPVNNKVTTPEPPTTPDPGTDFKCEEEGFFPHPRDCKKYFWCLDSGPSNLGIVAHQFTCPSGLYFNKAADSCDFSRNVLCKKSSKTTTTITTSTTTTPAPTKATTTRSRIVAATSKNTFVRPFTTTKAPVYEEEYEDDAEGEIDKPLRDPEEDPKVIKDLIELIKKVGGVEELEKLLQQDGDTMTLKNDARVDLSSTTPPTFSKSLYAKVLSRPNSYTSIKNRFNSLHTEKKKVDSTESDNDQNNKYSSVVRNSRPNPQNAGLDTLPEFDGFLKEKPKYVTIRRTTSRAPITVDDDAIDTAEEIPYTKNNPSIISSTLSYQNIKRTRPSFYESTFKTTETNFPIESTTSKSRLEKYKIIDRTPKPVTISPKNDVTDDEDITVHLKQDLEHKTLSTTETNNIRESTIFSSTYLVDKTTITTSTEPSANNISHETTETPVEINLLPLTVSTFPPLTTSISPNFPIETQSSSDSGLQLDLSEITEHKPEVTTTYDELDVVPVTTKKNIDLGTVTENAKSEKDKVHKLQNITSQYNKGTYNISNFTVERNRQISSTVKTLNSSSTEIPVSTTEFSKSYSSSPKPFSYPRRRTRPTTQKSTLSTDSTSSTSVKEVDVVKTDKVSYISADNNSNRFRLVSTVDNVNLELSSGISNHKTIISSNPNINLEDSYSPITHTRRIVSKPKPEEQEETEETKRLYSWKDPRVGNFRPWRDNKEKKDINIDDGSYKPNLPKIKSSYTSDNNVYHDKDSVFRNDLRKSFLIENKKETDYNIDSDLSFKNNYASESSRFKNNRDLVEDDSKFQIASNQFKNQIDKNLINDLRLRGEINVEKGISTNTFFTDSKFSDEKQKEQSQFKKASNIDKISASNESIVFKDNKRKNSNISYSSNHDIRNNKIISKNTNLDHSINQNNAVNGTIVLSKFLVQSPKNIAENITKDETHSLDSVSIANNTILDNTFNLKDENNKNDYSKTNILKTFDVFTNANDSMKNISDLYKKENLSLVRSENDVNKNVSKNALNKDYSVEEFRNRSIFKVENILEDENIGLDSLKLSHSPNRINGSINLTQEVYTTENNIVKNIKKSYSTIAKNITTTPEPKFTIFKGTKNPDVRMSDILDQNEKENNNSQPTPTSKINEIPFSEKPADINKTEHKNLNRNDNFIANQTIFPNITEEKQENKKNETVGFKNVSETNKSLNSIVGNQDNLLNFSNKLLKNDFTRSINTKLQNNSTLISYPNKIEKKKETTSNKSLLNFEKSNDNEEELITEESAYMSNRNIFFPNEFLKNLNNNQRNQKISNESDISVSPNKSLNRNKTIFLNKSDVVLEEDMNIPLTLRASYDFSLDNDSNIGNLTETVESLDSSNEHDSKKEIKFVKKIKEETHHEHQDRTSSQFNNAKSKIVKSTEPEKVVNLKTRTVNRKVIAVKHDSVEPELPSKSYSWRDSRIGSFRPWHTTSPKPDEELIYYYERKDYPVQNNHEISEVQVKSNNSRKEKVRVLGLNNKKDLPVQNNDYQEISEVKEKSNNSRTEKVRVLGLNNKNKSTDNLENTREKPKLKNEHKSKTLFNRRPQISSKNKTSTIQSNLNETTHKLTVEDKKVSHRFFEPKHNRSEVASSVNFTNLSKINNEKTLNNDRNVQDDDEEILSPIVPIYHRKSIPSDSPIFYIGKIDHRKKFIDSNYKNNYNQKALDVGNENTNLKSTYLKDQLIGESDILETAQRIGGNETEINNFPNTQNIIQKVMSNESKGFESEKKVHSNSQTQNAKKSGNYDEYHTNPLNQQSEKISKNTTENKNLINNNVELEKTTKYFSKNNKSNTNNSNLIYRNITGAAEFNQSYNLNNNLKLKEINKFETHFNRTSFKKLSKLNSNEDEVNETTEATEASNVTTTESEGQLFETTLGIEKLISFDEEFVTTDKNFHTTTLEPENSIGKVDNSMKQDEHSKRGQSTTDIQKKLDSNGLQSHSNSTQNYITRNQINRNKSNYINQNNVSKKKIIDNSESVDKSDGTQVTNESDDGLNIFIRNQNNTSEVNENGQRYSTSPKYKLIIRKQNITRESSTDRVQNDKNRVLEVFETSNKTISPLKNKFITNFNITKIEKLSKMNTSDNKDTSEPMNTAFEGQIFDSSGTVSYDEEFEKTEKNLQITTLSPKDSAQKVDDDLTQQDENSNRYQSTTDSQKSFNVDDLQSYSILNRKYITRSKINNTNKSNITSGKKIDKNDSVQNFTRNKSDNISSTLETFNTNEKSGNQIRINESEDVKNTRPENINRHQNKSTGNTKSSENDESHVNIRKYKPINRKPNINEELSTESFQTDKFDILHVTEIIEEERNSSPRKKFGSYNNRTNVDEHSKVNSSEGSIMEINKLTDVESQKQLVDTTAGTEKIIYYDEEFDTTDTSLPITTFSPENSIKKSEENLKETDENSNGHQLISDSLNANELQSYTILNRKYITRSKIKNAIKFNTTNEKNFDKFNSVQNFTSNTSDNISSTLAFNNKENSVKQVTRNESEDVENRGLKNIDRHQNKTTGNTESTENGESYVNIQKYKPLNRKSNTRKQPSTDRVEIDKNYNLQITETSTNERKNRFRNKSTTNFNRTNNFNLSETNKVTNTESQMLLVDSTTSVEKLISYDGDLETTDNLQTTTSSPENAIQQDDDDSTPKYGESNRYQSTTDSLNANDLQSYSILTRKYITRNQIKNRKKLNITNQNTFDKNDSDNNFTTDSSDITSTLETFDNRENSETQQSRNKSQDAKNRRTQNFYRHQNKSTENSKNTEIGANDSNVPRYKPINRKPNTSKESSTDKLQIDKNNNLQITETSTNERKNRFRNKFTTHLNRTNNFSSSAKSKLTNTESQMLLVDSTTSDEKLISYDEDLETTDNLQITTSSPIQQDDDDSTPKYGESNRYQSTTDSLNANDLQSYSILTRNYITRNKIKNRNKLNITNQNTFHKNDSDNNLTTDRSDITSTLETFDNRENSKTQEPRNESEDFKNRRIKNFYRYQNKTIGNRESIENGQNDPNVRRYKPLNRKSNTSKESSTDRFQKDNLQVTETSTNEKKNRFRNKFTTNFNRTNNFNSYEDKSIETSKLTNTESQIQLLDTTTDIEKLIPYDEELETTDHHQITTLSSENPIQQVDEDSTQKYEESDRYQSTTDSLNANDLQSYSILTRKYITRNQIKNRNKFNITNQNRSDIISSLSETFNNSKNSEIRLRTNESDDVERRRLTILNRLNNKTAENSTNAERDKGYLNIRKYKPNNRKQNISEESSIDQFETNKNSSNRVVETNTNKRITPSRKYTPINRTKTQTSKNIQNESNKASVEDTEIVSTNLKYTLINRTKNITGEVNEKNIDETSESNTIENENIQNSSTKFLPYNERKKVTQESSSLDVENTEKQGGSVIFPNRKYTSITRNKNVSTTDPLENSKNFEDIENNTPSNQEISDTNNTYNEKIFPNQGTKISENFQNITYNLTQNLEVNTVNTERIKNNLEKPENIQLSNSSIAVGEEMGLYSNSSFDVGNDKDKKPKNVTATNNVTSSNYMNDITSNQRNNDEESVNTTDNPFDYSDTDDDYNDDNDETINEDNDDDNDSDDEDNDDEANDTSSTTTTHSPNFYRPKYLHVNRLNTTKLQRTNALDTGSNTEVGSDLIQILNKTNTFMSSTDDETIHENDRVESNQEQIIKKIENNDKKSQALSRKNILPRIKSNYNTNQSSDILTDKKLELNNINRFINKNRTRYSNRQSLTNLLNKEQLKNNLTNNVEGVEDSSSLENTNQINVNGNLIVPDGTDSGEQGQTVSSLREKNISTLNFNRRFQKLNNQRRKIGDDSRVNSTESVDDVSPINSRRIKLLKFRRPVSNSLTTELKLTENITNFGNQTYGENSKNQTNGYVRRKLIRKKPLTIVSETEFESSTPSIEPRNTTKSFRRVIKKLIRPQKNTTESSNSKTEELNILEEKTVRFRKFNRTTKLPQTLDSSYANKLVPEKESQNKNISESRKKIFGRRKPTVSLPSKNNATDPSLLKDINRTLENKRNYTKIIHNLNTHSQKTDDDDDEEEGDDEDDYDEENDESVSEKATIDKSPVSNLRPSLQIYNKPQPPNPSSKLPEAEYDYDDVNEDKDDGNDDDDDNDNDDDDTEQRKTEGTNSNAINRNFKLNRPAYIPNNKISGEIDKKKGNVPVGYNRQIVKKIRIRPTNKPRFITKPLVADPIPVGTFTPLQTTPALFKSTNTKNYERKYYASSTEQTTQQENTLLEELNIDALNARNKKIFEITSKKHTTAKPKLKDVQITNNTDSEYDHFTNNTIQTNETSEINEINNFNNLQEGIKELQISNISSTESPLTTSTGKYTTLQHVFSVDDQETTTSEMEISTNVSEEKEEKLVEINRVIEVSSKENKFKSSGNNETKTTTSLKIETPSHTDKLGEISRVKLVKIKGNDFKNGAELLIESRSTVADYTPTEPTVPTATVSEFVRNSIPNVYKNDVNEKRGRQLKIPEVLEVETSTIALEGLFENNRQSKELNIDKNLVYATSLGEVVSTNMDSNESNKIEKISNSLTLSSASSSSSSSSSSSTSISKGILTTQEPITVISEKSVNYVRPIVPLLRPESNESSPLVISIANLDKVILSKAPKQDSNSASSAVFESVVEAPNSIKLQNKENNSNFTSNSQISDSKVENVQTSYSSETHIVKKKIQRKHKSKSKVSE